MSEETYKTQKPCGTQLEEEAWPEPKAAPWSHGAVLKYMKGFYAEQGQGHGESDSHELELPKDERTA